MTLDESIVRNQLRPSQSALEAFDRILALATPPESTTEPTAAQPPVQEGAALAALRELLDTTYSEMPSFEQGSEAQNAWADRRAKARNNAAALLAARDAQGKKE
jgi:hypothetical protein